MSESPTFINRAGSCGRDVAGNAARKRKLLAKLLKAYFICRNVGIDFAVRAFQIGVGAEARPAVSGTGNVNDVEVVFFNQAIEMNVDEIQSWSGAPMTEQAGLNVLELKRFTQERICVEIDLADREIVCGAPVGVNFAQFFGEKRFGRMSGFGGSGGRSRRHVRDSFSQILAQSALGIRVQVRIRSVIRL